MQKEQVGFSLRPRAQVIDQPSSWFSMKAAAKGAVEIDILGDIGGWGVSAKQFAQELSAIGKGAATLKVGLHSLGGDIIDGIAIYNLLKSHPARVEITILGIAASMGSVIAMAGDVVSIPENAWVMVHKPWGIQGGDANDMRDYADMLDKFEASLMTAYMDKTGLDETALSALLATETWLMGAEAVEKGFADQVIGAVAVSAHISLNRTKDFEGMPQQAKALLGPQASAPGAVTPPAPVVPAPSAPAPVASVPDMAAFQAQETQRRNEIKAAFGSFADAHGTLLTACLDDMQMTPAQAQAKLLAALGTSGQPAQAQGVHIHAGNGDIVRQAMGNALAARAGLATLEQDNNHYRGLTLQEMARMSLTEKGISAYGMDRMEMIGMAFTHTSSDFGNILSDTARIAMLLGYDEAEETFQRWTKKGELSDFKVTKRVGLESFTSLDRVADGGEYKYASLNDTGEAIQLATYGKLFSISRQTIINDALGAFTTIPKKMGDAAIRTVGNLVYANLMTNPKMSDNKALFHVDHNNLMTGSSLSVAELDKADAMMGKQTDKAGTVLNISPGFLIVPRGLKSRAKVMMTSMYDPDGKTSTTPNTAQNMAEVIADARIDKALAAGVALPWFLAGGANHDTMEVSYLDGNDKPYLEQQAGWNTDGTEFKVRIDAGVSPTSYKALLKNPGSNA